jgi:hypothetical protein
MNDDEHHISPADIRSDVRVTGSDDATRRSILTRRGARGEGLEALLEANRSRVNPDATCRIPSFPLTDEPQLQAWRLLATRAGEDGAWQAVCSWFPQLMFPVREGICEDSRYQDATRRGLFPDVPHPPDLEQPERIELLLQPSLAGTVPVVVAATRTDFETLVRAFTARGEPRPVPSSMGACLVAGLNDWSRIHAHRRAWEARDPSRSGDDNAWRLEFRRLTADKPHYQDRLVILSRGPYSGVAARDIGVGRAAWEETSLAIRREHECTHYFTLRVFGGLQHNLLEELLADLVGLIAATGRYDARFAARFLGLEAFPVYRSGGRLENYLPDGLSDAAFDVLAQVVVDAIDGLVTAIDAHPAALDDRNELARLIWALTPLSLEELAADDLATRVAERLEV